MIVWRTIAGIIAGMILIGTLRSCWLHHQCELCGNYNDYGTGGRLYGFTIEENNFDVTYCNFGSSTPLENRDRCYKFKLEKGEDSRTFYLRVAPREQELHPAAILTDGTCRRNGSSGPYDRWLCDGTVLGVYDQYVR